MGYTTPDHVHPVFLPCHFILSHFQPRNLEFEYLLLSALHLAPQNLSIYPVYTFFLSEKSQKGNIRFVNQPVPGPVGLVADVQENL